MSTIRWTREKAIEMCSVALKSFEDTWAERKAEAIQNYIKSYSGPTFWNLWHSPLNIEEEAKRYVEKHHVHKGWFWQQKIKDIHYVALNSECVFVDVNIDVAKVILNYQKE